MSQSLHFRPYSTQDFERCLAIYDSNCPKYFAAHEREAFAKFLTQEQLPFFVVMDDKGQMIACGGFIIEKGIGELVWGMVDSVLHCQGVGTFLFTQRLARIKSTGATELIMDTSQESLGFYQRYGFQVLRETLNGYGIGLHRYDLRLHL